MTKTSPLLRVSADFRPFLLEADETVAASAINGWRDSGLVVRTVRGRKMRSRQGLFDEFAAALQFPLYFGENADAFDRPSRRRVTTEDIAYVRDEMMRARGIVMGAGVVPLLLSCTAQPDDDVTLSFVVVTSDGTASDALIAKPSEVQQRGNTISIVFDSLDLPEQWDSIVFEPVLDGHVPEGAESFPLLSSDLQAQVVFAFSNDGCRYVGSVARPSVPVVKVEAAC